MKHLSKPTVLSAVCAAAGAVCMCLRHWFYTAGVDGKGLLIPNHPGDLLSWLAAAAAVAVLLLSLRKPVRCRFVPSRLRALGLLFSALGFGSAAWLLIRGSSFRLATLTGIFAAVSAL